MENLEIKGKTVLISGANRGLGKALVEQLIKKGVSKVYAGSRNIDNLDDLKNKYTDILIPVQLDVTNQNDILKVSEQIDKLDILINNAGIMLPGTLLADEATESLQQNMNVNVWGLLNLSNAFRHHFEGSNASAIVNIISVAGFANMPMLGTYSVSKATVHSITQGMRGQMNSKNTQVTGVYPGPMDTDMVDGWDLEKADTTSVAKNILEGIENRVEDIFPDPMSQQVGPLYLSSPKAVEQNFANMQ